MARKPWQKSDPLFRGDEKAGVTAPDPKSKTRIVPHILYLGGKGRETPYSSTSESREVAQVFAGSVGQVWKTRVSAAQTRGAKHLPRKQLLQDLRGKGKGKAKWTDAWEVAQAAAYVQLWSEHLLDWSGVSSSDITSKISATFQKA